MARTYGAPLSAEELPLLFTRVWRALDERRAQIDALNVFPVPDADTGTNMVLTIKAGLDALRDARRRHLRDHHDLAQVVIRGVIRGARGNSGVILSQVLRAVVEETTRRDTVDAAAYAAALRAAEQLAYSAVVAPVSGTMLSVIAAAATEAEQAVADGAALTVVSRRACVATRHAVERTPDQLAVLKDANVVDAGGRGFEVLITAVHAFLTGEHLPVAVDVGADLAGASVAGCHTSDTYPYEVQYLLDADNAAVGPLRDTLSRHGDSVVVVAAGDLINVHVHTANVGAVIDVGVTYAPPQNVTITDLRRQIRAAHPGEPMRLTAHNVELFVYAAHPQLHHLIGTVPGVHLRPIDSPHELPPNTAKTPLVLTAGDTPHAATVATTVAQMRRDAGRSDALVACDSPVAVLAAVSVFDATGVPDQVLSELHTVLDTLTVATVTAEGDMFTLTDSAGVVRTGTHFADVMHTWLTDEGVESQLITVMFGDASTLQQRSDIAQVVAVTCVDAEQLILDLPGASVVCWIGVE